MRVRPIVLALAVCTVPWISQNIAKAEGFDLNESLFSFRSVGSLAASGRAMCRASDWEGTTTVRGSVVRGVDGDTIIAKIKGKDFNIRFLSIDTPETNFMGKSQGEWAEKAKARLEKFLPEGAPVEIELEDEKCDRFGRVLAHVWMKGLNVNKEMVRLGYAVNYCIWPNATHCEEYGEFAEKNLAERKGIFSDPDLDLAYVWRSKMRKEKPSKFVGDLHTYDVYQPNHMDQVDVGSRVFFMKESEIKDPYELIE